MLEAIKPTAAHQSLMDDLIKTLSMKKHAKLSNWEKMALAAQTLGRLVAFESQHTSTQSLEMIVANIRGGNKTANDAIEQLKASVQP